jgi:hypothetical protein
MHMTELQMYHRAAVGIWLATLVIGVLAFLLQ